MIIFDTKAPPLCALVPLYLGAPFASRFPRRFQQGGCRSRVGLAVSIGVRTQAQGDRADNVCSLSLSVMIYLNSPTHLNLIKRNLARCFYGS